MAIDTTVIGGLEIPAQARVILLLKTLVRQVPKCNDITGTKLAQAIEDANQRVCALTGILYIGSNTCSVEVGWGQTRYSVFFEAPAGSVMIDKFIPKEIRNSPKSWRPLPPRPTDMMVAAYQRQLDDDPIYNVTGFEDEPIYNVTGFENEYGVMRPVNKK